MNTALEILLRYRRIAVVGLSPNDSRPSYGVTEAMMGAGYEITGVRPGVKHILGRPCYPKLSDVPAPLELVNVFRAPEFVPEIVDEAIRLGAKAIWLQLGVGHAEAEAKAEAAGLLVVSERCIMVEHRRFRAQGLLA